MYSKSGEGAASRQQWHAADHSSKSNAGRGEGGTEEEEEEEDEDEGEVDNDIEEARVGMYVQQAIREDSVRVPRNTGALLCGMR